MDTQLTATQQYYLQTMGLEIYNIRNDDKLVPGTDQVTDNPLNKETVEVPDHWLELRREVAACTRCNLHRNRTQTVFGVGDINADWLIIGEAPGAEEDRQGEPFVGRAGKLLNSMLQAIGLQRGQVFIANILKCRPPNNRDPAPEEVVCCESYLKKQIEWIQPKIILALGRVAAQNLLKVETPIGKMRGQCYEYPDPKVPVVVTYHPAYLLRSPKEKRKSWDDLQLAMQVYRETS